MKINVGPNKEEDFSYPVVYNLICRRLKISRDRIAFSFYSFDCNEKMHVHIQRENMICKFWLEAVVLARNQGFAPKELNAIREIIRNNRKQNSGGMV